MAAPHSKPTGKASQRPKPATKGSAPAKKRPSKPAPKPVQQKTKSTSAPARKKKRVYTEKELGVPQLNGIRPAGVQKPPNAKKGKHFVDDKEGMNAILAMVLAEKEGNIESKMMRARQLEEIREAKKAEAEKRVESKKRGFEERKQDIKDSKKRGRKSDTHASSVTDADTAAATSQGPASSFKKSRKRVSFG